MYNHRFLPTKFTLAAGLVIALLTPALLLILFSAQANAFLDYFFTPPGSAKWQDMPRIHSQNDANRNGLSDTDEIIAGARVYVQQRPLYRNAYYAGGIPPKGEGVCTDVIWSALLTAGYDLQKLVDQDIRANPTAYPRARRPDSNIDYRRVANLKIFFQRHAQVLGTRLVPGDRENLATWQPGDIVTFANPDHIAILSDKHNSSGVPYLLHNQGPWGMEDDSFVSWYERGLSGHFRFPAK